MNNKQTGWLIAVIVVLVVAAGVWYFVDQNNNIAGYTAPVVANESSTSPSVTPQNGTDVVGQPASYTNWNTYHNATSGFAFEYPSAFNGKPLTQSLPFDQISVAIAGSQPTNNAKPTALPQILVLVSTKKASDTVESDISKMTKTPSQCNGTYAITTSTVAGQEQALITCNLKPSLGLDPYSMLDFYHGTLHLQVTVNNYPSALTLVQQIGNTFTFSK